MKQIKPVFNFNGVETTLAQKTKAYLIRKIIPTIATGLAVALIWHWFNVIKPYKIYLYLPYAYEYAYLGATYDDPGRKVLEKVPIELQLDNSSRRLLRLGILNTNIKTLKKVVLHIRFPEGIKIVEHKGWVPWDPDKIYFTSVHDINNGLAMSLQPITIEFAEPKVYKISYTITGEDIKYIRRQFFVKAIK